MTDLVLKPKRMTEVQKAALMSLLSVAKSEKGVAELHHALRCHFMLDDQGDSDSNLSELLGQAAGEDVAARLDGLEREKWPDLLGEWVRRVSGRVKDEERKSVLAVLMPRLSGNVVCRGCQGVGDVEYPSVLHARTCAIADLLERWNLKVKRA